MKFTGMMFAAVTFVVAGCGGSTSTPALTVADAAVIIDSPVTPPADVPAVSDASVAPADTSTPPALTYPAGPYGSRICARFEPFTLQRCDGTDWHFDGDDFFDAPATVIIISAGWCVPCQMEAAILERELIQPYADRHVRFVQLMVQNPDRRAVTGAFCQTWVDRYGLTFPELMDPDFISQPFVPMTAFPGNVIVDRQGRIRFREYGTSAGLGNIKTALDNILANPNTCP